MVFENFQDLWSMAGHGGYVWAAYGITFTTLIALLWVPLRANKQQHLNLRDFYRRQGASQKGVEE